MTASMATSEKRIPLDYALWAPGIQRETAAILWWMSQTYFQRGFKLKAEVGPILEREYASAVIEERGRRHRKNEDDN